MTFDRQRLHNPKKKIELISLTPEAKNDVDELFESFTQYKYQREAQPQQQDETQLQHALSEHVAMPSQEIEMDLTLENTVSEQSTVTGSVSKKSDDVILAQLDEGVVPQKAVDT